MTLADGVVAKMADRDRAFKECERIWRRLEPPAGGVWTCDRRRPFANPLLNAIIDITNPDAQVRDTGIASWRLQDLLGGGFLTASQVDDYTIEYRKAEKRPEPDTRSFQEIANAELKRQQDFERRRMDQEYEQQKRFAEFHSAPARNEMVAFLNQALRSGELSQALGLTEVEARLSRLEAAIERIEAALGVSSTNDAA